MYLDGNMQEGIATHAQSLHSSSRLKALDEGALSAVHSLVNPVVVFDPESRQNSIAASSSGFQRLTGYKKDDLLLQPPSVLLRGVPAALVSKSGWKDFADYCRSSRNSSVVWMAESSISHPFGRPDGSVFTSLMTLGRCAVQGRTLVVAIYGWLSEGPMVQRLTETRWTELEETNREVLRRVRQRLHADVRLDCSPAAGSPSPASSGVSFYTERLQERTIIFRGEASAARREPEELPVGCMLFGSVPLKRQALKDLRYALRVDGLVQSFSGLPWVGFTWKKPVNSPGLYPRVAKCLAQSIFVGGSGEATRRTQDHNFKIGFGKIPQTEVATWSLKPDVSTHIQRMPAEVKIGDHIECRYTCGGHMQFVLNGRLLFDFDVGCPPEVGALYWPVVDICSSISAMTLLGMRQAAADDDVPLWEAPARHVAEERRGPHGGPVKLHDERVQEAPVRWTHRSRFVEEQSESLNENEAPAPQSDASTFTSDQEQEGLNTQNDEQAGLKYWKVPVRSNPSAFANDGLDSIHDLAECKPFRPGLANSEGAEERFTLLGFTMAALATVCAITQITFGTLRSHKPV